MINYFRNKTEKKIREISILWNEDVFQGMTRSQIIEFKKKYKKLILEQYKLNLKQESLNKKIVKAKKSILATEKQINSSLNTSIKVAVSGVFIATIITTNQMSAMETISTSSKVPVIADNTILDNTTSENSSIKNSSIENSIVEIDIVENDSIEDTITSQISENNVMENAIIKNNINTTDSIDSNKITEKDIMENNFVTNNIINDIKKPSSMPIEGISNNVIEENIIIFDQALEMGIDLCENSQFDNIIISKEVSVLDIIERANNPIVSMWFEMLLDTNINNKTLEFNVSYIIPKNTIRFNSREGGFFADIDTSKIEARLDWNMQKAINDSIQSGVDEFTRDLLFQNNYKEVESVMMNIHEELNKELIASGTFLEEVKKDVSNKLTEAITWNVEATLN